MDFDAITVFVKVVEAGSFAAAARQLGMPKTTVSARVAALEKRLGVSLIQRTTRNLRMTEAGEAYFRHCVNAVREIELGEAALLQARERPGGLLRITAPFDVGHTVLPPIIEAYLRRYPGTRVEMRLTNEMLDLIADGIDLALRAGVLKDSSLVARRFFGLEVGLWASPEYLLALQDQRGALRQPDDLRGCRFVARSGVQEIALTDGGTRVRLPVASRVTADDFEAVKALALLGEGVAWLPDFLAHEAAVAGSLVRVLPGWRMDAVGAFYFVYPRQAYTAPSVTAFIEMALEWARKAEEGEQRPAG
ncbi:LysR family transcriptional regulator [Cupriavidus sp. AU9028]|uniref:LysR family transcriptional regulator n=1 Tax=Cupriavidus sp. AU9028 TaxID=2871157 RepID=UPI001C93C12E|nr:LysR family transcriptional regulator [Cupriavidus sp. AU9028]MBY4898877.1 LysR family transcriptional regulator [Cupriavidus sp. AU9028]